MQRKRRCCWKWRRSALVRFASERERRKKERMMMMGEAKAEKESREASPKFDDGSNFWLVLALLKPANARARTCRQGRSRPGEREEVNGGREAKHHPLLAEREEIEKKSGVLAGATSASTTLFEDARTKGAVQSTELSLKKNQSLFLPLHRRTLSPSFLPFSPPPPPARGPHSVAHGLPYWNRRVKRPSRRRTNVCILFVRC